MVRPSSALRVSTLLLALASVAAQNASSAADSAAVAAPDDAPVVAQNYNRTLIPPFDVSDVSFCAPQVLEALVAEQPLDFERFRIIGQSLDCRNVREYLFPAALRAGQGESARYIMSALPAASPQLTAHDNEGRTPLLLAAIIGDEDVVAALVCAHPPREGCVRADTMVLDIDGRTALHHSAGYSKVTALLLNDTNVNAMISTFDIYGDQPLHMALRGSDPYAPRNLIMSMHFVLGRPATERIIQAPNAAGDFPAHLCHFMLVWDRILSYGASAIVRNSDEALPLHTNAGIDGTALDGALGYVLNVTLTAGFSVDEPDANGRTPLHYAAEAGSIGNVRMLMQAGAGATMRDVNGRSPLQLAIANGYYGLVPIFSEVTGGSPFNAAVKLGRLDALQVLVFNMSIPIDGADPLTGRTGIFEAAESGQVQIVDWFLDQGLDATRLDDFGESVLAVAIVNHPKLRFEAGQQSVVARLLDRGAPARQTLANDSTALHVAARQGVPEAVDELLMHGAQPDFVDFWGRTALHVASTADAADALLRGGARQVRTDHVPDDSRPGGPLAMEGRAMNAHGLLPLHSAAINGHAEVVHALLAWRQTTVDETCNFGNTALHLAAAAGRDEAARTLLRWCAPADARDGAGRTPREVAHSHSTRALLEQADRSPGRCQCDCGAYELDAKYAATGWSQGAGTSETCVARVRCQIDDHDDEEEEIYCRGGLGSAARWVPSETELPCALAHRAVSGASGRWRPSAMSGVVFVGALLRSSLSFSPA